MTNKKQNEQNMDGGSENLIIQSKLDHANYTVADRPYEFSTGITLTPTLLEKMNNTRGGCNFQLSEVIDNFPSVETRLKQLFTNQYSLDDPDKFLLNFLLISAGITGIRTPDPYNGRTIAGTLTQPAVHASTMPTDVLSADRQHKKMLPFNFPASFVDGHEHAFTHTLTPEMASHNHILLDGSSMLNDRLIFPQNRDREGTGGSLPPDDDVLVNYVKNKNNGVLVHGHSVNNDSMYPTDRHYPTREEMLTADAKKGGVVETQHIVALRDGGFAPTWYDSKDNDRVHKKEKGVQAPIDDFARKTYHFIDSMNEARSTNFHNTGLWMDIDHGNLPKIKGITAKMSFKILPIVPFHKEGKEFIMYHNFVKHLKDEIKVVDRPFAINNQ
jgi:hypothetical protein